MEYKSKKIRVEDGGLAECRPPRARVEGFEALWLPNSNKLCRSGFEILNPPCQCCWKTLELPVKVPYGYGCQWVFRTAVFKHRIRLYGFKILKSTNL